MKNLISDLNKLVNTIQKIDKLLTEKPKSKSKKKKI
jgi:hypothetical protein